jgi:hypothetical protein
LATRVTIATFGALAGLAGVEHGIGEIAQGNKAPGGVVILSWPDAELFRVLGGEPAMTIVPNLLVTGVLAVVASLLFLVWVTMFVERPHGGPVLLLLSLLVLLVGGGFGPPLLGLILGIAATRHGAPSTRPRSHLPGGARRALDGLWPWSYAASLVAWLALLPGSVLFDHYIGVPDPDTTIAVLTIAAFGSLLLTIASALARDAGRPPDVRHAAAGRG